MTSLTDVYEGEAGRVASRRQQLVGAGLFLTGAVGLVGAIVLSTTGLSQLLGLEGYAAREIAGTIAGLGLPAVVLGVFAILPASRRIRATAGLGLVVSVIGVVLFRQLYPYNWLEGAPLLALLTGIVYFAGILTTFWCLFAGLATVKTRNDPGGTARMEVTEEGTIRLVEEARSLPGMGGIGFFGQDPDGAVETQTNRQNAASDGGNESASGQTTKASSSRGETGRQPSRSESPRSGSRSTTSSGAVTGPSEHSLDPSIANAGPEASPSTDGGTTAATGRDPITETAAHRGEPDTYCGNCRHFQYVMHDDDIEPYCTYHEQLMDDMEPCSAWMNND